MRHCPQYPAAGAGDIEQRQPVDREISSLSVPPKLTSALIARSRVIAKGRRIRDVDRLVATHGGVAGRWAKKSSPPLELDGEVCEVHWYEHHGIGRVEIKVKRCKR